MRDGFSREVAESAVQRALDCGLIDDVRYGAVLVRTRVAQGRGRRGIEDELERAGIAASDIPGWPEEFFSIDDFNPFRVNANAEDGVVGCSFGSESSDEQEIERALALLRRKPLRSKNIQGLRISQTCNEGLLYVGCECGDSSFYGGELGPCAIYFKTVEGKRSSTVYHKGA